MISIVVPTYNEEKNVSILYENLMDVLERNYEIIFVDDGSTDNTFNELQKLHEKNKKVKIIKFRKNFGQSATLKAGFDYSKGDIIITMDADLQNDPHDIPQLLEKIKDYDCISGWRCDRKDSVFKKIPSKISNWLHRKLTGVDIHDSGCTLKAYKKEAIKNLELYGETHRYIPAMLSWQGYKIGEVKVTHHKRKYGKTKYNYTRFPKGLLDLLFISFWKKYQSRPLHLMGGFGIISFIAGFFISLYLTVLKLFFNVSLSNRPLLLLGVLLMIIGVQFIVFGFLAEISIRTYFTNKKTYTIEKVIE